MIKQQLHESIKHATVGFRLYFNISANKFMDPLLTQITNKYNLDIIRLDDWLHSQGYIEKKAWLYKRLSYFNLWPISSKIY